MSATWTAALVATIRPNGSFGLSLTRRRASISAAGVLCEATRCKVSPSSRNTLPYLASQMRAAWSSILAKACCRSPGELEMICNTSAVAACCCKASLSSRLSAAVFRPVACADRRRFGAARRSPCDVAEWPGFLGRIPIATCPAGSTNPAPIVVSLAHWQGRMSAACHRAAPRSIEPQLRDVSRISLELALLDALDEVCEHRVGAAGQAELFAFAHHEAVQELDLGAAAFFHVLTH